MAKIKKEVAPKKEAKPIVLETPAQRLSGIIKTCRKIMRKDKGMNGDGDRLPMLTWIMFLKFLDDNEQLQEVNAQLEGKKYKSAIDAPYRWRDWAKDKNLTGDDLLTFISNEKVMMVDGTEKTGLFYYLRALQSETGAERKDVIATVFKGITNRMINGYLLRDVINEIEKIHFTNNEEVNSLSHLYESILKEMRDASGDAGEFYTPRPVVKFMVEMLNPQIGEIVLDPACGTGGFLVESFEHLKKQAKTVEDKKVLQEKSIIGGEAKPLPYLLSQMNLLLHGLNYPIIDSGNSLRVPLRDISDKDRVDIVLANPPFGGEEEKGILNNFPSDKQTNETALLFLQLIMRKLKRKKPTSKGGRASIVVPNSLLLANGIASRIINQLIKEFNVHTIVRLGDGVFAPYTDIPSNLIFFDSTKATDNIWFYEIDIPEFKKKYSKSKPIRIEEFENLKKWWNDRTENENAWSIRVADVIKEAENGSVSINLDLKNPNKKDIYIGLNAESIANDIYSQISENLKLIENIKEEIKLNIDAPKLPLHEAIEENTEEVIVDPSKTYEFAGVYGFGKGIFKRQALEGNNTSYKVFNRLHEDEIVISKVKGWEGAIALVPKEFEGLFLSPQYPSFRAKEGVNIKYISEYCKHPKVWRDLLNKSKGIGARRNSISVTTFLSLEIPLPELEIQNKIVDALEKLSKLKRNQVELNKKLDFLTPAILENVFQFNNTEITEE
jgi:type I restriction enzyme M protein